MTTAGRSSRASRDRGAVATEFGLLVTLVSVLVTGSIAALLGQVWHFDPCEIFQVCASDSGQTPGVDGDGGVTPVDPSTVPPATPTSVPSSVAPTASGSAAPTDCATPPAAAGAPAATSQPAPTDCAAPSGPSVP